MKIGLLTYMGKDNNYYNWIKSYNEEIEVITLNHKLDNLKSVLECSGVILSGGYDINPTRYGETNDEKLSEQIDDERDEFELRTLELLEKNQIPTLGICRGLQIGNVFYGGSLYQHVDGHRNTDSEGGDLYHKITAIDSSLIYQLTDELVGRVNSAHHQAAKKIGDGLIVTSYSEEGIVESIEKEKMNYKFLLVQWHPERMKDKNENKFSFEILKWFINK